MVSVCSLYILKIKNIYYFLIKYKKWEEIKLEITNFSEQ
jgi:hypothetical protein